MPEVRNLIRDEFPGKDVALIAAGGIADGSGVSAALSLGAEAAVMGTRVSQGLVYFTNVCLSSSFWLPMKLEPQRK